jgi:hypothetical protein
MFHGCADAGTLPDERSEHAVADLAPSVTACNRYACGRPMAIKDGMITVREMVRAEPADTW